MLQRFSFALLAIALLSVNTSGQQRRPITLQDLVSLNPFAGQAGVLSPDGKHFAVIEKGQIVLLPVDEGAAVPVTAPQGAKSEVSWSPDSKKPAFVSQGQIWVVHISGGEPVKLTDDSAGPGDPRGGPIICLNGIPAADGFSINPAAEDGISFMSSVKTERPSI